MREWWVQSGDPLSLENQSPERETVSEMDESPVWVQSVDPLLLEDLSPVWRFLIPGSRWTNPLETLGNEPL